MCEYLNPPFIIHDAFVSPGWTLAEMQTTRREATSSGLAAKWVTVTNSHAWPPAVTQRTYT